jgi:hypothetical protein
MTIAHFSLMSACELHERGYRVPAPLALEQVLDRMLVVSESSLPVIKDEVGKKIECLTGNPVEPHFVDRVMKIFEWSVELHEPKK